MRDMNISKIKSLILALFIATNIGVVFASFLFPVSYVSAAAKCSLQVVRPGASCDETKDCTDANLNQNNCGIIYYLKMFINVLSAMVGIVVIGVIIVGGIQYATSAGDPGAAAAAKKRIINALIALVMFFLTYAFLQWVVPGGLF